MDSTRKGNSLTVPTPENHESSTGRSSAISHNAYSVVGSVEDKIQHVDDGQADAWHKQSQPYKLPKPKRKGKRRNETLLAVFCQWIVDHQIGKLELGAHAIQC